jgi:hypothetical protein
VNREIHAGICEGRGRNSPRLLDPHLHWLKTVVENSVRSLMSTAYVEALRKVIRETQPG